MSGAGYVELQLTTNYSFLQGASHPDEMVAAAAMTGMTAMGVSDRNSLAGVVRAHVAGKQFKVRTLVGARLDLTDAPSLLCYPADRAAYGRLSRLLSLGRRRASKGDCAIAAADLEALGDGQILIALAREKEGFHDWLGRLKGIGDHRLYLAATHYFQGEDARRIATLAEIGAAAGVPLLATNDVLMHAPERRPLLDILACIHAGVTLAEAGYLLAANAERHLKSPREMQALFADYPEAVANSRRIAEAISFSLDDLRYDYPSDPVAEGETPDTELARLTRAGAARRYPRGVPKKVEKQITHELKIIKELGYATYFLSVNDLVTFARSRGILCQGRGSAANSAVCFCLGVTAVDPARLDLLFERFVSAARDEPPDIDVDFEHERREEVIQYIYQKYGRERAGLTATVITYRTKSSLRETGKVLGFSEDAVVALQGAAWRRRVDEIPDASLREAGFSPEDPDLRLWLALASEMRGFPRHLSQHTGGFVLSRGPLCEIVPIENAAMADRTVIQWDKDDLEALGILKIDVLALGMLSCIRKALDLISLHHGRSMSLAGIPTEDEPTYDMLCAADTVGVFQVESRAQMSMLPRLRPRCFYDLVIQVAIVRPGPIQGDMVHPYLRRRQGKEQPSYPSQALEAVLGKTLGIPLFQEQAMNIAIVGAGFSPSEADGLRRSMATFRRFGQIEGYRDRFLKGMLAKGYDRDFSERCFKQIEGFADYGFPESHAASFALLVYVSSWLKRHYPAAFCAALLNAQPMGFYAPAQLVRDAQEHGVLVLPPDVNFSHWDATLEPCGDGLALRLGLRQIKGFGKKDGAALVAARHNGYLEVADLWRRAGLGKSPLNALARADAFGSLGLERRRALWAVDGLTGETPLPLFEGLDAERAEPEVHLPKAAIGEEVMADYKALRLSLKAHPVALLRPRLPTGVIPCAELSRLSQDASVTVAGLTIGRQRPAGANGVIFITLEDETGLANLIVWPGVFENFRRPVLRAGLMVVSGSLQREGDVIHLIVRHCLDRTALLMGLREQTDTPSKNPPEARHSGFASRDFC